MAYQALRIAIDLVGTIGRQALDRLLLDRRCRTTPRVVGRAISDYAPHTPAGSSAGPASGPPGHRATGPPGHRATIEIDVPTHH